MRHAALQACISAGRWVRSRSHKAELLSRRHSGGASEGTGEPGEDGLADELDEPAFVILQAVSSVEDALSIHMT